MSPFSKRLNLVFSIGLALISVGVLWFSTQSTAGATEAPLLSPLTPSNLTSPSQASLHNPTFDNHDWYFFSDRYDPSYPDGPGGTGQPILPDDDNNLNNTIPIDQLQDWRLWYVRDTPLIQTFVESVFVRQVESVAIRSYGGSLQFGGLYQVIRDATPCLVYNFQMYGLSKPDPGTPTSAQLRVGIDQVGWHPDSQVDPAVPGSFPDTTVWGTDRDYKNVFGPLTVTAEARASEIVAYTYAYALGGRSHAIVWDEGSFADVTPEVIHDPANLPAPGGTSVPTVVPGREAATVSWTTSSNALSQVYYRVSETGTAIPGYSNKVFIPIVVGSGPSRDWMASTLNKTPTTAHSITLTGLQPGRTYEYKVVSRGLSGDQCVTWVSETYQFTTNP